MNAMRMARRTLDGWEIIAPAKLNLFLEILGRRPDGFHDIESLMVATDLHDVIHVEEDPTGAISLECDDPSLPTDSSNLVVRAALAIKRESGVQQGVKIRLAKAIPAQAGLAGGSSDAASTLFALNLLWDLNLPGEILDQLAAGIGSDVAFFRQAPAAVCRGRGELVEPIALDPNFRLWFVLVCPPVGLETAKVYGRLREESPPVSETRVVIEPMLEAFSRGEPAAIGACLFNRLQPTAESLAPELLRVRDALAQRIPSQLCGSLMSGSGSAYFGLGRDRDAAMDAAHALSSLDLGRVRVVTCGP